MFHLQHPRPRKKKEQTSSHFKNFLGLPLKFAKPVCCLSRTLDTMRSQKKKNLRKSILCYFSHFRTTAFTSRLLTRSNSREKCWWSVLYSFFADRRISVQTWKLFFSFKRFKKKAIISNASRKCQKHNGFEDFFHLFLHMMPSRYELILL